MQFYLTLLKKLEKKSKKIINYYNANGNLFDMLKLAVEIKQEMEIDAKFIKVENKCYKFNFDVAENLLEKELENYKITCILSILCGYFFCKIIITFAFEI